ncbi:MAG: response regulator [Trichloromonadaceae bacterium]
MKPISILIVDDHGLVRDGLRQLLSTQADLQVLGEAEDGIRALELAKTLRPDVILLDIALPRISGLDALRLIREAGSPSKVIMLSMFEKEAYVYQALEAGAQGYVLKGASSGGVFEAVRTVHGGGYFFSPEIHSAVIESYLSKHHPRKKVSTFDALSEREKQVFQLVVQGNSTNEIGKILTVSPKTVEKHRAAISKKLGLSSPLEMVRFAVRTGILDPEFWTN